MRVTVLRAFALGDGRTAAVGEVLDLPDPVAAKLIRLGRARVDTPAAVSGAPVVQVRDPGARRTREG